MEGINFAGATAFQRNLSMISNSQDYFSMPNLHMRPPCLSLVSEGTRHSNTTNHRVREQKGKQKIKFSSKLA